MIVQHWLSHFFGLDNLSGPFYGFWSGAGSDLTELAILGGLIAAYRKHNCHVKGCWRISYHPVDGTRYVTCKRHHPDVPRKVSVDRIASEWSAANTQSTT